MNFVMGLAHLRVSEAQWYIGARKPKVWGSIPHENSKLFNLSHAPDNTKNIFLYFYRAQNLKFLQISYPTN